MDPKKQSKTSDLSDNDLFVVGVGASAGGLESLEQMFDEMPSTCGLAFVIVQHLSPDFKSLMGELLARHTELAIHRVEDGMRVEANSLYLIPPNQDMIISDGKLLLTPRDHLQSLSLPIDRFFRSLAQDVGPRSIAIVLSGTGSDGSRGVQTIHDAGGLVIVQSPDSAKFDGMPGSAIQTQVADVIVKPSEIANVLEEYMKHRNRETFRDDVTTITTSSMERILQALHQRHHIDFSHYKPTTIGRRIKRRIEMDSAIDDMASYAALVEHDVDELDKLYQDLLIGVTEFFRDVGPFKSLREKVLPRLLAEQQRRGEFRVWVAACATGEEAYSIAILIDECLRDMNMKLDVKIFATDLHKASIRTANSGVYPEASLREISRERRDRYFMKTEDGFQISPEIRRMVVFAPQNLIKDPPFTRLSLVTCRNFLIYLMPPSQKKVISLFHFGLHAGGVLLLGSSESPGDLSDEFEPVHERHRIFRKRRDVRIGSALQGSVGQQPAPDLRYTYTRPRVRSAEVEKLSTMEDLLGHFMPPSIVVDQNRHVLQVFGGAGKYLSVSDGRLSNNLLDLIDEDLKLAVVGAMQRSAKSCEPVCYESLQVKLADQLLPVKLTVVPLKEGDKVGKYVISLEPLSANDHPITISDQTQKLEIDEISRSQLGNLEHELRHTKENLQATVEEMETSNEELQATNEELIASNEELQATNEELHSVNEELFTVNSEYQLKISELTELTNDFENLLVSTDVHTLFLDPNLCIRRFTPKIAEVFHLVPHDFGRRIDAFMHSINCDRLSEKAADVLRTGEKWEERVEDAQSNQYLLRVLPYRANDEILGVVITLIEISSLVEAQAAVVSERERFERAIRANRDGTWDWPDLTKDEMWWSPTCYRLLGYEPGDFPPLHKEWMKLVHPDDRSRLEATAIPTQDKCYVEVHQNFEYRMKRKSGEYRWYCHRAIVDYDENGKAIRMTGSVADIEERKQAELYANEGIRLRDNFLSMLSHELRNPMGAVLNAVESFAAEHDDSQTSLPQEMKIVRRQTNHMARLLDDLLDVARFGQGKIEFRKEVVDLCELASAAIESANFELRSKNQKLRCSISEGPILILGDPARLAQAQINLIVNASKFSDQGQEIDFSIVTEGDHAIITVADQGVGIAETMRDSIFDLFVQSESTLDRSIGGMGVGLSLARSIVEAHQGKISVASEGQGKGSSFEIRLPLTKIPMEKPASSNRLPSPEMNGRQSCRVLLVEDNVDALEMLAKSLRRRGHLVETAVNGKLALQVYDEFHPDVAVIDIGLPEMDGYEVAKAIGARPQRANSLLVALTGYGQKSDYEASLESGFDCHLVKPLKFQQLNELIVMHAQKLPARR